MALAAFATQHGGITMLNNNQLNTARKIILALKPVEEIMKIISTSSANITPTRVNGLLSHLHRPTASELARKRKIDKNLPMNNGGSRPSVSWHITQ